MNNFNINNYAWKSQDNISWKQNYDGMLSTYNNIVAKYIEISNLNEELKQTNKFLEESIKNLHQHWNETKKARDDWQLSYNKVVKENKELLEKYWQAQEMVKFLKLFNERKS